jgi:MraZ protein
VVEIVFQGTSPIALDAKGRITVPVRQRDLLMQACEGRLTLTKHPDGFLWVMPRPRWELTRERLMSMSMDADPWRRVFLGSAVDVEIDAARHEAYEKRLMAQPMPAEVRSFILQ